jgi:FkbM family methyltransferase
MNLMMKEIIRITYKSMTKIIQNLINFFGFKIIKIKKKKYRDFDQILKKILKKNNNIIFDVGANKGQSLDRYRKIFKNTLFYSFEPSLEAFKVLKLKYENFSTIKLFNIALGSEKKKKIFYEYKNNELSSFIKINKKFDETKKKISVEIDTIDSIFKKNNLKKINLLKMDTQGYEEPILIGAKNLITGQKIDLIELEIILGDYYDKSSSFKKIEDTLLSGGYRLLALDRRLNIFENKKFYFNALYASQKIYKKIVN